MNEYQNDSELKGNVDQELKKIINGEFTIVINQIQSLTDSVTSLKIGSLISEAELMNANIIFANRDDKIKDDNSTFRTMLTLSNIDSQLSCIERIVHQVLADPNNENKQSTFRKILCTITTIKAFLKNLAAHLWQHLNQMMTLKNWSVSGNVDFKVPGLFSSGIALQLTFGT